jgi:ubiquinone/menaquinone biosynthesis C-methylase UbiE
MDHRDHVHLLQPAGLPVGGVWADLGAGSGAFTLALRELVGPQAGIFAVDRDQSALHALERAYLARFGSTQNLQIVPRDFSLPLGLPPLDGMLMANALHFFKEKRGLLERLRGDLKPGGAFLLVEYNVEAGNPFVPYPISFEGWRLLAPSVGFSEPTLLARVPSRFLKEFFSALGRSLLPLEELHILFVLLSFLSAVERAEVAKFPRFWILLP